MGKLLEKHKLDLPAQWYFPDARFNWQSRIYQFKWPNEAFPHQLFVNDDSLVSNRTLIEIRKWVEQSIADTVIISYHEHHYRVYYDKAGDWDKSYEVRNSWTCFSFETEEAAALFKLKFSDIVKPFTLWHPDNPQHKEIFDRKEDEKISNN